VLIGCVDLSVADHVCDIVELVVLIFSMSLHVTEAQWCTDGVNEKISTSWILHLSTLVQNKNVVCFIRSSTEHEEQNLRIPSRFPIVATITDCQIVVANCYTPRRIVRLLALVQFRY
jgi:hypothetical protein